MKPSEVKLNPEDLKTPSPNSCTCKFIPLDEQWGVKMYSDVDERDKSLANQELCWFHAPDRFPEPGEAFEVPYGGYRYGYITERIQPFDLPDWSSDWEVKERAIKAIRGLWGEEIDEAKELADQAGFFMEDDHMWNFGIKNGKATILDFGF